MGKVTVLARDVQKRKFDVFFLGSMSLDGLSGSNGLIGLGELVKDVSKIRLSCFDASFHLQNLCRLWILRQGL
jgi:hypothetical protein